MKIAFYFFLEMQSFWLIQEEKLEYHNKELSWKSKNNDYNSSKVIVIIQKTNLSASHFG